MDIEKLLSDKTKKVALVAAHYDDEVLFAGGILSKYANTNWTLISCFSPPVKEDDIRVVGCKNVVDRFNITWIRLPFIRTKWNKKKSILANFYVMLSNMNVSNFMQHLVNILNNEEFDIIISHNSKGEYGNVQHSLVHSILRFYKGNIQPNTAFLSFAMSKEGILENPDYVLELDEELFEKKLELIHMYPGKSGTLLKFGIVNCKKEALWYEVC